MKKQYNQNLSKLITVILIVICCIIGVFIYNKGVTDNTDESEEEIVEFDTKFIDDNKEDIEKHIGEYEILNHIDKTSSNSEGWVLGFRNIYTNKNQTVPILKDSEFSITEQLNNFATGTVKQKISNLLGIKNEMTNKELMVYTVVNQDGSSVKLNEFDINNFNNVNLNLGEVGIFFNDINTNLDKVQSEYGETITNIYNMVGEKTEFFRVTVYNKAYELSKNENGEIIWTYNPNYGKAE